MFFNFLKAKSRFSRFSRWHFQIPDGFQVFQESWLPWWYSCEKSKSPDVFPDILRYFQKSRQFRQCGHRVKILIAVLPKKSKLNFLTLILDYLGIKNFFKNPAQLLFYIYGILHSCNILEKSSRAVLEEDCNKRTDGLTWAITKDHVL